MDCCIDLLVWKVDLKWWNDTQHGQMPLHTTEQNSLQKKGMCMPCTRKRQQRKRGLWSGGASIVDRILCGAITFSLEWEMAMLQRDGLSLSMEKGDMFCLLPSQKNYISAFTYHTGIHRRYNIVHLSKGNIIPSNVVLQKWYLAKNNNFLVFGEYRERERDRYR